MIPDLYLINLYLRVSNFFASLAFRTIRLRYHYLIERQANVILSILQNLYPNRICFRDIAIWRISWSPYRSPRSCSGKFFYKKFSRNQVMTHNFWVDAFTTYYEHVLVINIKPPRYTSNIRSFNSFIQLSSQ